MNFEKSQQLQHRAHHIIPGGAHTYAKGDDQFPVEYPGFIERGAGCRVWDVDGNQYIEYGSGLRAVTLGHAFEPIVSAVQAELTNGSNFARPAAIEVTAAEQLQRMIPGAEMVKFAKDGSTVVDAAIRLARAATNRDLIAKCSDHPFFSTNDWFIGATPVSAGIPAAIKDLTVEFEYNRIDSLRTLFETHPNKIACVILEPSRGAEPENNFLHDVKQLCQEQGAVLIFDEMITGFRYHNGGGQAYYGVEADLATFGKAIANGFAVSALTGKAELMEQGGLLHDKKRVFLLSTTHGGETHSLAAAIATMKFYQSNPVVERLKRQGERLRQELEVVVANHRLENSIQFFGHPANLVFSTLNQDGKPCQLMRSLLLQEAAKQGLIMPSLVVNYSHDDQAIDETISGWDKALDNYELAWKGNVNDYLNGRPSDIVYREYNGAGPWLVSQPDQTTPSKQTTAN